MRTTAEYSNWGFCNHPCWSSDISKWGVKLIYVDGNPLMSVLQHIFVVALVFLTEKFWLQAECIVQENLVFALWHLTVTFVTGAYLVEKVNEGKIYTGGNVGSLHCGSGPLKSLYDSSSKATTWAEIFHHLLKKYDLIWPPTSVVWASPLSLEIVVRILMALESCSTKDTFFVHSSLENQAFYDTTLHSWIDMTK